MSDTVTKFKEINQTKSKLTARDILKKEYPLIYTSYKEIIDEQFELFAKKHLDYGMGNVSAGTQLVNDEEKDFAMTGLWYRLSDKINRWKNMILTSRKVQNETLIDTFQDITNYGIIAQLVENNKWKEK
jgi:predicted nuclease of restriction endonuclease-like (RecB) superfamily